MRTITLLLLLMTLSCSTISPLPEKQSTGFTTPQSELSHCSEKEVITNDGMQLNCRISYPQGDIKAVIYLIHGLGQYQTRFDELSLKLIENHIAVVTYDLRGHGVSSGVRGHIKSMQQQRSDLEQIIETTAQEFATLPRFIYGHSFGGALALNYALMDQIDLDGVILSAPFIRSTEKLSPWMQNLGELIRPLLPNTRVKTGIDIHSITRDSLFNIMDHNDPMSHSYVTAAYLEVFDAGDWALENISTLSVPLLLMHGTEDRVTSIEASRELRDNANGLVELKEWEGYYHDLKNDIGKEYVFEYVVEWINEEIKRNEIRLYQLEWASIEDHNNLLWKWGKGRAHHASTGTFTLTEHLH